MSEFYEIKPSPALLAIPCSLRSHRIANRTQENADKSPCEHFVQKILQNAPPNICRHYLAFAHTRSGQ